MQSELKEALSISSESQITRALRANIPPSECYYLEESDPEHVYREASRSRDNLGTVVWIVGKLV